MSWLILLFAGLLEVVWAAGLKGHGGSPWIIAGTIVAAVSSVVLLGVAMQQLPLSTAYVAWTGIGILGTFLVGAFLFAEVVSPAKLIWAALIVVGIIGLKFSS